MNLSSLGEKITAVKKKPAEKAEVLEIHQDAGTIKKIIEGEMTVIHFYPMTDQDKRPMPGIFHLIHNKDAHLYPEHPNITLPIYSVLCGTILVLRLFIGKDRYDSLSGDDAERIRLFLDQRSFDSSADKQKPREIIASSKVRHVSESSSLESTMSNIKPLRLRAGD